MKNKYKYYFLAGAAAFAAALVIMLNALAPAKLILEDARTGEKYGDFPLRENTFSVTFIHSVNKSPVSDIYEVRNGQIYVTGTVYYGFGAGVPTELTQYETLTFGDDGEMIISGMELKIPELIYVVGTVSDHILSVNGEEYSLRDMCGRNSAVKFKIE